MTSQELPNRLKSFAYRTVPLCELLPVKKVSKFIEDPPLLTAFTAWANYVPAREVQPGKTYKSKQRIAGEEVGEAMFWSEPGNDLRAIHEEKIALLLKESDGSTGIPAATGKFLKGKTGLTILK